MLIQILLFCSCLMSNIEANELFLTTPQILDHRNISYENHTVITEDGYILSIFRLPKKERRGVVVLQHSLSLDSAMFFVSQKRSIAMEIYNSGYELWLPNFRGLTYSDKHVDAKIQKLVYWNFSFHEIGFHDISTILNHVNHVTGTKAIVINHSLSSTASLVYSSLKPAEAQSNVKVFVNMASSAFMNHTQSPVKSFLGLWRVMKRVTEMLDIGAINYDNKRFMQMIKKLALQTSPPGLFQSIAEDVVDYFCGKTSMGMDVEEFPMIVSLALQAVSNKIVYHYVQLIKTGRFCKYDYGDEENMGRYNTTKPPDYPLGNIRVPIYLVVSDSDALSDAWGSNLLYAKLPDAATIYGKMDVENVNHVDYLVGKGRFVYFEKILNFINGLK